VGGGEDAAASAAGTAAVRWRAEMAEGVDERTRAEFREHGGVGGSGAADDHALLFFLTRV
jgi:hypothetical protein